MGSPTPRGACGPRQQALPETASRLVASTPTAGKRGSENRPFGRVKQGRNAFSVRGPTRVADPFRQHDEPSVSSARRRRTSRHLRRQGRPPPRKPVRSCSCTLANPRAPRGVVRFVDPPEYWPSGHDSCVFRSGQDSGVGCIRSERCGLDCGLSAVLSGRSGFTCRPDASCRPLYRPASASSGRRRSSSRDASIRARIVATPRQRTLHAALASALSSCPHARHRKARLALAIPAVPVRPGVARD